MVVCVDRDEPLQPEDVDKLVDENWDGSESEDDELLLVTRMDIPRETARYLKRLAAVRDWSRWSGECCSTVG